MPEYRIYAFTHLRIDGQEPRRWSAGGNLLRFRSEGD
jgi:hypothetical protein